MIIRKSTWEDCDSILRLYQLVSQSDGGLARKTGEISKNYVEHFTRKGLENGIQFVATDPLLQDKLRAKFIVIKWSRRCLTMFYRT